MPSFLDDLQRWYQAYEAGGGRPRVRVEFQMGAESPDRGAWIDVDGVQALGRMTLSESGHCDTEMLAARNSKTVFWRHRVVEHSNEVAAIADELVDHVAGYFGGRVRSAIARLRQNRIR